MVAVSVCQMKSSTSAAADVLGRVEFSSVQFPLYTTTVELIEYWHSFSYSYSCAASGVDLWKSILRILSSLFALDDDVVDDDDDAVEEKINRRWDEQEEGEDDRE